MRAIDQINAKEITSQKRNCCRAQYELRNSIRHLIANTSELVILTVMKQHNKSSCKESPEKNLRLQQD